LRELIDIWQNKINILQDKAKSKEAFTNDDIEFIKKNLYGNSVIVKYAMDEIKRMMLYDISTGQLNNFYNSEMLPSTPNRNIDTEGRILEDGKLIAEQNNRRLKYADNRFILSAKIEQHKNNMIKLYWYVEGDYNFASYPIDFYSVFQIDSNNDMRLRIDDGLSAYLVEIGIAEVFCYRAEWNEIWHH
jgi:hypothetical protein